MITEINSVLHSVKSKTFKNINFDGKQHLGPELLVVNEFLNGAQLGVHLMTRMAKTYEGVFYLYKYGRAEPFSMWASNDKHNFHRMAAFFDGSTPEDAVAFVNILYPDEAKDRLHLRNVQVTCIIRVVNVHKPITGVVEPRKSIDIEDPDRAARYQALINEVAEGLEKYGDSFFDD